MYFTLTIPSHTTESAIYIDTHLSYVPVYMELPPSYHFLTGITPRDDSDFFYQPRVI